MSSKVGTLQGLPTGRSIWPAAVLASLVMLTIAVAAVSLDLDQGGQGETTFVGRHVVNTPSELNAHIGGGKPKTVAGGTLANTPTELSGGIRHKFVTDTLGTNTPIELSGGLNGFERFGRHQRI